MPPVRDSVQQELARLARSGLDVLTFLQRTEEQLRRVVPFQGAACFFTIDPSTLLLTGHINADLATDDERRRAVNLGVVTNEYREDDVNKFAALATGDCRAGILADAAGDSQRSRRYHSLIRPFGLDAELRAALVVDSACWGGVALFRTGDQPAFQPVERDFVHRSSRHLAEGIRTALVLRAVDAAEGPDAPGLILLNADAGVEAIDTMAVQWLKQLIQPGPPTADALPEVIYAVAEHARLAAGAQADRHGPVQVRVPTRTGRWLTLHGTALAGRQGFTAVIVEPARAPEIAPLLLEAYGLSAREQGVTLCVLRGLSTAEIAGELFISAYTVQDHLKAVFEKVGVRSRAALVARVFFDHYFPRMQEESPLRVSPWAGEAALLIEG